MASGASLFLKGHSPAEFSGIRQHSDDLARPLAAIGAGRFPTVAAAATIVLGLAVLAGWIFDDPLLKRVHPSWVAMNPATAVAFILTGTALGVSQIDPVRASSYRLVRRGLAAAVFAVAFVKLFEYVFGDVAGIDQILFRPALERESIPSRMAPNTALCFMLIAGALLSLDVETPRGSRPSELFSLATLLAAALVLIGYLYGAASLKGVEGAIPMALHTAIGFSLLAAGLLCTHPDRGIAGFVASRGATGTTARRLLPAAVGVPILIGWLRVLGERRGLYGFETGAALTSWSASLLLGSVALWTLRALGRAEEARSKADAERHYREQELRQANQFLDAVIENIPDMIFIRDAERLSLQRLNRAGEGLLGRSRGDLIGKTVYDLLLPEQAELSDRTDRQALGGDEVVDILEQPVETPSGTRWIHTRKVPLRDPDGTARFLLGISQDITDRKRAEEALRSAKEAAETANRELESFSYSVSHDLRAPLRAIDGFSRALAEDCGERLDAQGRKHLERIRGAAGRMSQLIDDLLNLSRVTRAEIRREAVDLSALAEAVAGELQRTKPQRRVEWRIAPNVAAEGDAQLLRIVLMNLLGNAFKFTGKEPQARIEFGRGAGGAAGPYFVRDNGAGFEMEYAGKLFAAFQRLHQAAEFPGTGIGLAIVQRIVLRHGGRVWAEGAPGRGATFFFTLRSDGGHHA